MPDALLSFFKDRVRLGLLAMLLALAGGALLVGSSRANTLLSDGQQASATVVEKLTHRERAFSGRVLQRRRHRSYGLRLQIAGVSGTRVARLGSQQWQAISVGQTIPVVYSARNPNVVKVGSLDRIRGTAETMRAGAPYGFLLLAGALGAGLMTFMVPARD